MPTYVMHIGPPKAGSTYLQSCLAALREPLEEQGVAYHTNLMGRPITMNHEWMLATLAAGPNPALEAEFDRLNTSRYRYVILSTEGFFGIPEEQLHYLRSMTADCPFLIVYYCRRWSERIPSQWQQLVKSGRYTTFPEHFSREMRNPERYLDLNPKLVWDRFAQVFGRDSLRIMPFNTLVEKKIDLLDHFLDMLEVRVAARPAPDKIMANESPKMLDTEMLRALNYLYFQATGERSHQVRMHFLRKLRELPQREPLGEIMKTDLAEAVVDDASSVFRPLLADMMTYADRIVTARGGDQAFFRPRKRAFEFVQQNYLMHDEAVGLLRGMFDEVDPRRVTQPKRKVPSLAAS